MSMTALALRGVVGFARLVTAARNRAFSTTDTAGLLDASYEAFGAGFTLSPEG